MTSSESELCDKCGKRIIPGQSRTPTEEGTVHKVCLDSKPCDLCIDAGDDSAAKYIVTVHRQSELPGTIVSADRLVCRRHLDETRSDIKNSPDELIEWQSLERGDFDE